MNRKISLLNPWFAYAFLTVFLAILGFAFTKQQFSASTLGHAVSQRDKFYGVLLALTTVLICTRLIILYLLPKRDWQAWARLHRGKYSHPANLQIQPYGMILDMLEGTDSETSQPFVIMRAIQVFRQFGTRSSLASRHFVLLGRPGPGFSSTSKDGRDLQIIASKRYFIKCPSYEELVTSSRGPGSPSSVR